MSSSTKRLIQILSRFIAMGLLAATAKLGIQDDGTIATSAESIATGVGTIVAIIIDFFVHKIETGGVLKPAGEKRVKCVAWPAALLVPLVLLLGGCHGDAAFVTAVDSSFDSWIPEYRAYVEADESLTEDMQRVRLRATDTLREMVEEKKRELNMTP